MLILVRYLGRSIVGFTAMVMAVLMILFALYLFSDEQSDIGVGSYGLSDALLYALLSLPRYMFDLFPIGALIGALLALGNLARGSELAVMRASGVSVMRLGWWAGLTGLMLAALSWVVGDYIAPPLEQYARQQKAFAKYNEISLTGNQSAWAKDGNTFIAVQQQTTENEFGGVYVYRFDDDHHLVSVGHANAAQVSSQNKWQLSDYAQSRIERAPSETDRAEQAAPQVGDRVIAERMAMQTLDMNLPAEFLGLASMQPEALPGRVLFGMIRHLQANGLDAKLFETVLWTRIARTAALVFMTMLAVPFAMGSSRSGAGGIRTVLGVLVGAAFFMIAKMLENGAQVFNIAPIIVAWAPTALLGLVTFVALARAK